MTLMILSETNVMNVIVCAEIVLHSSRSRRLLLCAAGISMQCEYGSVVKKVKWMTTELFNENEVTN